MALRRKWPHGYLGIKTAKCAGWFGYEMYERHRETERDRDRQSQKEREREKKNCRIPPLKSSNLHETVIGTNIGRVSLQFFYINCHIVKYVPIAIDLISHRDLEMPNMFCIYFDAKCII